MEQLNLINSQNEMYHLSQDQNNWILEFLSDGQYELVPNDKKVKITIKSGTNVTLLEKGTSQISEINLAESSTLKHQLIKLEKEAANNASLQVQVQQDANYEMLYLDLAQDASTFSVAVKLLEPGARASYQGAVIAHNQEQKKVAVTIVDEAPHSEGYIDIYGVSSEHAQLDFTGIGQIKKGAKQAIAKQKCTMVVFDETASATAHPQLLIDENDVIASHANSVGTISDDIMFYLMSRGLTPKLAKQTMMFGYIKPVLDKLADPQLLTTLTKALEKEAFTHV